jgi:hypothetical protein
MSRRLALAAATAAGCVLAGCGAAGREDAAAGAAVGFASAVERGDGSAACDLLSPDAGKAAAEQTGSCADGVVGLPTTSSPRLLAEVWGDEALVRLEADTLFLHRFDHGWRVTAAGCTYSATSYDCDLEG